MSQPLFSVKDIPVVEFKGIKYQHKVLIYVPEMRVLECSALWLSQSTYETGVKYVKALQRFSNYLAEQVFIHDERKLLEWWLYVDVKTLKAWKTYRIVKRRKKGAIKPSNRHIDGDAHIVFSFLNWLKHDKGVRYIRWDGTKYTIIARADRLSSVTAGMFGQLTVEVNHDTTNVSVPYDDNDEAVNKTNEQEADADEEQVEAYAYLHDNQVRLLIDAFSDVVYKFITLTGYMTALRTHEVLAVPRREEYSSGLSFTAEPANIRKRLNEVERYNKKLMDEHEKKNKQRVHAGKTPLLEPSSHKEPYMIKKVLGKRNKLRQVRFNMHFWLDLMKAWWPIFGERKKLYEAKYGALPLHILWLDKCGEPIYAPPGKDNARLRKEPVSKLQNAFNYVVTQRKKNPLSRMPEFEGMKVSYYCVRHTYATNYLLRCMQAAPERSENQWLSDLVVRRWLASQMGHNDVNTTYNSYVHYAILMLHDMGGSKQEQEFGVIDRFLASVAKQ